MKKIICIVFVLLFIMTALIGCNKDKTDSIEKDMDRLNYNYDLTKYVTLDSYKTEVDTESESYQNFFNQKIREMMKTKKTEGTVAVGDVTNIDYVGKKNDVAFDGGTACGYNLTIGSGSFIDGFEEGLVGVEIGRTVDLELTFPEDYSAAELAGQEVQFTVTVNYVTVAYESVNSETAAACGYESAQWVMDTARKYAFEQTAIETVYNRAQINVCPDKELGVFYTEQLNAYKRNAEYNSMSFESYVSYYDMTVEEFEDYIRENYAKNMATNYTLCYYIIDTAGEKVTEELVVNTKASLDSTAGGDIADTGISENYIEAEAVRELANKIIIENATLKETAKE